jgi:hypothetical protein
MFEDLDLNRIQDENARELIARLLNLVETLTADLRDAQSEIQRLRDEVNRLKGEQGKPKIKGNSPKPPPIKHSSEEERRKPRQRHKSSKKAEIIIHREQVAAVDPASLPKDAQFKGHEDVVVQDILLCSDNILFHKQKYYAASTRKTYLGELPAGMRARLDPGSRL